MKPTALALILLAVLLAACADDAPTCAPPYTANGSSCCLDKDADGACDAVPAAGEAGLSGALDCSLCAPTFVTQKEEVIIYKYVCENGSVLDDPKACAQGQAASDAHLFIVSDTQDEEKVLEFEARPACRGNDRTAELHVVLAKAPLNLTVQVKEDPSSLYRDLVSFDGRKELLSEKYIYLGFCESAQCAQLTDAQLIPDGAYAVRVQVGEGDGRFFTRELLLDPTPAGRYGQQRC